MIYRKLIDVGLSGEYEISILLRSKKIFVAGEGIASKTIPYTNIPIFLDDLISKIDCKDPGVDVKIELIRENKTYILSLSKLMKKSPKKVRLFPNDKILFLLLTIEKKQS